MKKISIICPVYNSERYLYQLIQSIQNQSYDFFECLFIDDSSTDNSVQIIKAVQDTRFILYQNITNVGAQESRKKGFEHCSGEYVAFIDSDDYLNPRYLQLLIEQLEIDNSDIIMCQYEIVDENSKRMRVNKNVTSIKKDEFPLTSKTHPQVLLSKPAFWNKMFKHSFLIDFLQFHDVLVAQDLSIMPILFSEAKISYVAEILYSYRIINQSISNSYDKRLLDINKCFYYLRPLKAEYYKELEFMAIGHYYYQMSKTLYIKEKTLRFSLYRQLKRNLNCEFPDYQKNDYFRKRFFYRLFVFFLKQNIIFKANIIHSFITYLISIKFINKLIRRSDQ